MSEPELFVFAGGGSGGHLYPGLAVAQALRQLNQNARILFLATQRDIDQQILADCGFDYLSQPVVPIPRRVRAIYDFYRRWRTSKKMCRKIIRDNPVKAVLGLGGFASGPMMQVAARAAVPVAMLNPDAVPGRANRFGQRKAQRIFLQWDDSIKYFGAAADKCLVTGCPIRADFTAARKTSPSSHRQTLNLASDSKVLVIVGGSQGGKNLNDAVLWALTQSNGTDLLNGWQILHFTGSADYERTAQQYRVQNLSAIVQPFTNQMPAVLSVANLVIARAGASTLAELTAMAAPSILLPYPYHRDQHQLRNAQVLAQAGAAEIVADQCDAKLTGEQLVKTIETCIMGRSRLAQMAQAAVKIGKLDAAVQIAKEMISMGRPNP
ncbi:MAG: UDP-N-acetylglucosamine--N-acetylmuramyl-(pentapeptide) pyrophosphoryl-undecaprenol N-acetylglucosamine transferase [Sedimentisphaerales bacterium]|nr:UDP-N-acetylglucosamine--N-acetylmuramyl-(pentapeptide) pyrophosphoryl-undecaprenol N-acetylglucosamine transferase [Sedimentisphaerales bacterium]